ncbi:MAG TPA: S41 family peptidase [Blastocatellia bacterium]|nr:S41 family peptidase [Blastocatellia bacterium]
MRRRRRHLLLVAAIIMPLAFAGAHPAQRYSSPQDEAAKKKITDDFVSALLLANDKYAGSIDHERLTRSSIVGMLHTLDPHSSYFDRKSWEEFLNDQRSRYTGIGSVISQRYDKVYILAPTEGAPAYRQGLRYGDHIAAIDGVSTKGWNTTQVREKLIGPEGTQVTVTVQRLGVSHPLEFKIVRAAVPRPSVANYFMVGNGVGYINLQNGFNTTTLREVAKAISELMDQGMTSLILDLRSNGGGLVDQAYKVSNLFLYRGQRILSMRGRAASFPSRDFDADNTSPIDCPLVVLINRGSASASEIVAGALQDHDRARIVGENSFGKGLVQNPFPLADGSALVLTTGHYYTPSGRLIQRPYLGRSFYDYYLQRGDKEGINRTEEKRTDSGRTVYGGGGIQPDVEVKIPAKYFELQRVWLQPAFAFARELVAGRIPGFPEFKIDRPPDHRHVLRRDEYVVTDKLLAAFKAFVRDHKELNASEARIDKDAEFIKRQIRYDVVTAAYGLEVAYQVLLEGDAQMQQALAEIPKAKQMAEDIRRLRATGRNEAIRRD